LAHPADGLADLLVVRIDRELHSSPPYLLIRSGHPDPRSWPPEPLRGPPRRHRSWRFVLTRGGHPWPLHHLNGRKLANKHFLGVGVEDCVAHRPSRLHAPA